MNLARYTVYINWVSAFYFKWDYRTKCGGVEYTIGRIWPGFIHGTEVIGDTEYKLGVL